MRTINVKQVVNVCSSGNCSCKKCKGGKRPKKKSTPRLAPSGLQGTRRTYDPTTKQPVFIRVATGREVPTGNELLSRWDYQRGSYLANAIDTLNRNMSEETRHRELEKAHYNALYQSQVAAPPHENPRQAVIPNLPPNIVRNNAETTRTVREIGTTADRPLIQAQVGTGTRDGFAQTDVTRMPFERTTWKTQTEAGAKKNN